MGKKLTLTVGEPMLSFSRNWWIAGSPKAGVALKHNLQTPVNWKAVQSHRVENLHQRFPKVIRSDVEVWVIGRGSK